MIPDSKPPPLQIGRYTLHDVMSQGGTTKVHYGRLLGPVGFSRTVAIKRLHSQFANDPEFVTMFADEARLVSRIRHPNVVPTLDVVAEHGELFLVMDYVQGETLARLILGAQAKDELIPPSIICGIVAGALRGLHAAHEAAHPRRGPLGIVHRDVSPRNVMVGVDGLPRVLDFGIAKALHRLQITREGEIKGKIPYMSPEQLQGMEVTRQTDIFAAAIVLWEALTACPLFGGDREGQVIKNILEQKVIAPSVFLAASSKAFDRSLLPAIEKLDAVVLRGLSRDLKVRFATARDMASALEACIEPAAPSTIGEWVERIAHEGLEERALRLASLELHEAPIPAKEIRDALDGVSPETAEQPLFPEHADPSVKLSRSTPTSSSGSSVASSRSRRRRPKATTPIPTYALVLVAVSLAALAGLLALVASSLLDNR